MKKTKKIFYYSLSIVIVLAGFLWFKAGTVFAQHLKSFKAEPHFGLLAKVDSSKKNVFIIAENDGTEMFDLMAPFYLFNATAHANVYVVSEKKAPVLLVNSLFILPHYSFAEIDSLHLKPDVVVIPNVTVHLMQPPRQGLISWIKKQVSGNTIVLSICDGSATAAATGLYDGKPITTHATDFKDLKKMYPKPRWVNNTSVTESGNLYSTAGVSNAVEGSLTVIKRIFGEEIMQTVLRNIKYPHATIQTTHESKVVGTSAIVRIISKAIFRKNLALGVLLNDNLNEFELASLLDTYSRTFPSSLNTFSENNTKVTTRYGLTLYPTGDINADKVNELHILQPANSAYEKLFAEARFITYNAPTNEYPIDQYLNRIATLYGQQFKSCVKLTLDYN